MIPQEVQEILENQKYKIIGENGAVKLCPWLKEGMQDNKGCYKQRFYGIKSHRCLQMTPSVSHCTQKCLFCWRAYEAWHKNKIDTYSSPEELLDQAIEAQKQLLTGFGGSLDKYEEKLWEESKKPKHVAISLSGEPTLYPEISGLIKEVHDRDMTSFLVTNGTQPNKLKNLEQNPTQLYISLDASNKETYQKLCRPQIDDAWENLQESLKYMSNLDTRTVLRITLVEDVNSELNKEYLDLIEKANPDFIEVKAYMHIGYSRKRLERQNMPSNRKIQNFSQKISNKTNYKLHDNVKKSRVSLLTKKDPEIKGLYQ
ncbi:4-demethylwyosine synthase TYW1 [archaeon SCG-AAA382B04]|nr:4-demethylwyosine synthase TYW1 [archaeon SCG-AAA382B04]